MCCPYDRCSTHHNNPTAFCMCTFSFFFFFFSLLACGLCTFAISMLMSSLIAPPFVVVFLVKASALMSVRLFCFFFSLCSLLALATPHYCVSVIWLLAKHLYTALLVTTCIPPFTTPPPPSIGLALIC